MSLLHSTWPYIKQPLLYSTLLDTIFVYNGSTTLYLTIHYSTVALVNSTLLYRGST